MYVIKVRHCSLTIIICFLSTFVSGQPKPYMHALGFGQPIERELAGGEAHAYTIQLSAGPIAHASLRYLTTQEQTNKTKELAVKLAAANTEDELSALLEAEKESVTVALARALLDQGRNFEFRVGYEKALKSYNLAKRVAEQIGHQPMLAASFLSIGWVTLSRR